MAIFSRTNRLILTVSLEQICLSITIVIFFSYIRMLGGSQLYLGVLDSVSALIGLIWNPIIGSLGDSYGKKHILMQIFFMSAATNLLMVISNSLAIIFISRILAAFARPLSLITPTATEILSKEDQLNYFNRLPAVSSVSFIVGSFIGGYLSELNNGFQICYLIMVIVNLINYGILRSFPDETSKKEKKKPESQSLLQMAQKEMKNVSNKLTNVKWREYSDIFSAKLCFELTFGLFFRSFGGVLIEFGIQGRSIGYVITFMNLCAIASHILLAKFKEKLYKKDNFGKKRLFHAAAFFVVTALIMSFSNTIYVFASALTTLAIGGALADSTFNEALMARASDEDKGSISGAFESIISFGGLVTPISAGILGDQFGAKFPIKMSILTSLAGLFVTLRNK